MSRFNCDNVTLYTSFTTAFLHLRLWCVCVCVCVCVCACVRACVCMHMSVYVVTTRTQRVRGHLLEYDILLRSTILSLCDGAFSLMRRPHTDLVQ